MLLPKRSFFCYCHFYTPAPFRSISFHCVIYSASFVISAGVFLFVFSCQRFWRGQIEHQNVTVCWGFIPSYSSFSVFFFSTKNFSFIIFHVFTLCHFAFFSHVGCSPKSYFLSRWKVGRHKCDSVKTIASLLFDLILNMDTCVLTQAEFCVVDFKCFTNKFCLLSCLFFASSSLFSLSII